MSESIAAPTTVTGETLRVLLVEDQADVQLVMRLMLERPGAFQVEVASSGPEALEKAARFAPHVVISDLSMPGMNGYELMTRLRTSPYQEPFKAIALSGFALDYEEMSKAGFDTHLIKPVDYDYLFQLIKELNQAELSAVS